MITAPVITSSLAGIVLEAPKSIRWLWGPLALTPVQRWEAAGRFNTNFMTERWFMITGVIAIGILTVLLFVVSLHRAAQERKIGERLFFEYAERRGLSDGEREILHGIASRAGLKQREAIFTMGSAFDRGVAKMIEENLAQQGSEASIQLKSGVYFLREKLGFKKQPTLSASSATRSEKLSSRQIPAGKKLHITRRRTRDTGDIESTVIENNDMELTVKLTMPVESSPGELWRGRYYFGASVWEFDTSVISCNGDILVLNHGDNVRFVNRRRFLRVPVNKPAFIACFPFARTVDENSDSSQMVSGSGWGPPEFIPAVVTELAGPGLRIEAPLEVKAGERVLVVFRLDEERDQDLSLQKISRMQPPKIVEDIGEVRHTKDTQNGLSIAIELTGLNDSDVNELIRATNAASLRANDKGQDIPDSANSEIGVTEPVVVQGI